MIDFLAVEENFCRIKDHQTKINSWLNVAFKYSFALSTVGRFEERASFAMRVAFPNFIL